MHQNAVKWDRKMGVDNSMANKTGLPRYQDKYPNCVPHNRPCDECGEPVERGYIHKECGEKEANFWLDILY